MHISFIVAVVLLESFILAEAEDMVRELNLLGLIPFGGDVFPAGNAALIAMEMALEQVNNRTDILNGYKLNVVHDDTRCEAGRGINAMYNLLYNEPTKVMIIGGACSIVCVPCSESSLEWNLTTVSYSCMSPSLSNRERFPNFFRTVQPEITQNPARIELMRLFGWKRVAVLQQSYEYFTTQMDDIIHRFTMDNITLLTNEIFQTESFLQVQNLKSHDARIIVGGGYEDELRELFCHAFHAGLYGPQVQWILPNWLDYYWWKKGVGCSAEEFLLVADGAIYTGMSYKNPLLQTSIAGINGDEFEDLFSKRANFTELFGAYLAPSYFDSIWATSLALNATARKMVERGYNKTLDEFTYADSDINDIIIESLYEIDFIGIRGYTKFDENGDPSGLITISQQQGEEVVMVGLYYPETGSSKEYIEWINGGLKWRGGQPPRDGRVTIIQQMYVSVGLYVGMCLLAGLGILTAFVFFSVNLLFRNKRVIKMSSPNINNLILLGCVLSYATVFFQELDQQLTRAFCITRYFCFTIGFDLLFGALFAKTYRVHRVMIASTKTAKSVIIRDGKLASMVFCLVLLDSLILIIWQAVDPMQATTVNVTTEVSKQDVDIHYLYQLSSCQSQYNVYFTACLYVIQGLLLAFGAFLAWETRKVQIEALNDSKWIGMCIYNVVILAIMGVAINYVIGHRPTVAYAFSSSFIIAGTTLAQTLVFVPKIVGLRHNMDATGPLTTFTNHNITQVKPIPSPSGSGVPSL